MRSPLPHSLNFYIFHTAFRLSQGAIGRSSIERLCQAIVRRIIIVRESTRNRIASRHPRNVSTRARDMGPSRGTDRADEEEGWLEAVASGGCGVSIPFGGSIEGGGDGPGAVAGGETEDGVRVRERRDDRALRTIVLDH